MGYRAASPTLTSPMSAIPEETLHRVSPVVQHASLQWQNRYNSIVRLYHSGSVVGILKNRIVCASSWRVCTLWNNEVQTMTSTGNSNLGLLYHWVGLDCRRTVSGTVSVSRENPLEQLQMIYRCCGEET
jgi:hypothetical protein